MSNDEGKQCNSYIVEMVEISRCSCGFFSFDQIIPRNSMVYYFFIKIILLLVKKNNEFFIAGDFFCFVYLYVRRVRMRFFRQLEYLQSMVFYETNFGF